VAERKDLVRRRLYHILKKAGTRAYISDKLAVSVPTINGWVTRDRIPAERAIQLFEMEVQEGYPGGMTLHELRPELWKLPPGLQDFDEA